MKPNVRAEMSERKREKLKARDDEDEVEVTTQRTQKPRIIFPSVLDDKYKQTNFDLKDTFKLSSTFRKPVKQQ